MSVLVGKETRVLVQGMTGKAGSFHAQQMIEYGSKVVGGVSPGKGGTQCLGLPVFDDMQSAVQKTAANATVIFVPAAFAGKAIVEAAAARIPLIVCITEGIPTLDMIKALAYARGKGSRVIGPNCPGIITPGACKIGIMPGYIHKPGAIGVVSRSGTLTYEAVYQLTQLGLGQSTCIGIGGDPVIGTNFVDALDLFEKDPGTQGMVLIGEIGGAAEEEAAKVISERIKKPIAAFIAGTTAPKGKRMGHAGAIISGASGTAQSKIEALQKAGARVTVNPSAIGQTMAEALKSAVTS